MCAATSFVRQRVLYFTNSRQQGSQRAFTSHPPVNHIAIHSSSRRNSRRTTVQVHVLPIVRPEVVQMPRHEATMICTSITSDTVAGALDEIKKLDTSLVDIIELRLDCYKDFDADAHLEALIAACSQPCIVTYRPTWEGGHYGGDEAVRLNALRRAVELRAAYVDVEFKACEAFFSGLADRNDTKIILSSHNFESTPSDDELSRIIDGMWAARADIVKIATFANDITDSARVLALLTNRKGPTIALAMGEKGLPARLLAPKFGGFLTFGAAAAGKESAPGQPTVAAMSSLYRLRSMSSDTRVFGIVGNPVSHSKSPTIHNPAMRHVGYNGVYIPYLVDDMQRFLAAYSDASFAGFSVTIPHKEAAHRCADSLDDLARQIGAVNTLVRQPDGTLKGYNTDCTAAIAAIERGLERMLGVLNAVDSSSDSSVLAGKRVVVVGAGGAGRALAFGAANRGATVVVVNRNEQRAQQLVAELPNGGEVVKWDAMQRGEIRGDVLVNTTSVGMHPNVDATPVPQHALPEFKLVFDAVYNPLETRLLREARVSGCTTVNGLEMFVGQAAEQFTLFTGQPAPVQLMTDAVMQSFGL